MDCIRGSLIAFHRLYLKASTNPERTVYDVKRLIGRTFTDKTVQHDQKLLPFTLVNRAGKPAIQVDVKGKTEVFLPEEISAMVLSHMKETAEGNQVYV